MGISLSTRLRVLRTVVEFALLVLLMIAVPLVVAIDIIVLDHGVREDSVTEIAQETLLFASMVMIGWAAWKRPDSRGFLVLVAGLFGAMLIREADRWLDAISKGFWLYPALLVSISAIIYAARLRGTVINPMVNYAATKPFAYISIGLLIVLLFSRAFGSGQLWSEVMGDDYFRLYKTIIQEGLELLGYMLVSFGSALLCIQGEPDKKDL